MHRTDSYDMVAKVAGFHHLIGVQEKIEILKADRESTGLIQGKLRGGNGTSEGGMGLGLLYRFVQSGNRRGPWGMEKQRRRFRISAPHP